MAYIKRGYRNTMIRHSLDGRIITPLMKRIEDQHNRPIRELVLEALNAHRSIERAAEVFGIYNTRTMHAWIKRLDIQRVTKWE